MNKESHVVVIFPHPDDESIGAGGTIHTFRKEGVPVTYLCGTLGEMGRNMGTPQFANRETLKNIRAEELKEACAFLDIDYRLLGFRDKTIEFEHPETVIERVKKELEDIQPSLVITHYPEHGVHPDHNALGEATIEAVRRMEPGQRPTVWAAAITNNYEEVLGSPDVNIPVEKDFDFKLEAIMKHKSQAEGMLQKLHDTPEDMQEYVEGLRGRLGLERFFIWTFPEAEAE